MEETGFDDANLFDEFCKGFKVTGKATHCNEFPHGFQPPLRSVDDLKQNAVWLLATVKWIVLYGARLSKNETVDGFVVLSPSRRWTPSWVIPTGWPLAGSGYSSPIKFG